jgi:hypothetical protein
LDNCVFASCIFTWRILFTSKFELN